MLTKEMTYTFWAFAAFIEDKFGHGLFCKQRDYIKQVDEISCFLL
jgi:hypothetical protein